MTVSGVSASAPGATSATPSYMSSPAVQLAQFQESALSGLFGGASGQPGDSDLVALTSAVVALPMYEQPGLLTGLTQWDGGMTTGSERAAAAAAAPPANPTPAPPAFSFNPFDQSSWGVPPTGSTVDTTA